MSSAMALNSQDPLDGLRDIDWSSYKHAYGEATDIPDDLETLKSQDVSKVKAALWELYGSIWHQGDRYSASAVAVPFIARLAADPTVSLRADLIEYLTMLTVGDMEPSGVDVREWRTGLDDLISQGRERYQRSIDESAAAGLDVRHAERQYESLIRCRTDQLAAYDAGRASLPLILKLCEDSELQIRLNSIHHVSYFPEEIHISIPVLRKVLASDSNEPSVTAVAILACARLSCDNNEFKREIMSEIQKFEGSQDSWIKWAKALALFKLGKNSAKVLDAVLDYALGDAPEAQSEQFRQLPFDPSSSVKSYAQDFLEKAGNAAILAGPRLINRLERAEKSHFNELLHIVLAVLFADYHWNKTQLPPFDELTPTQQHLAGLLEAREASYWCMDTGSFLADLKEFGLPDTKSAMAEYVGSRVE